MRFIFLCFILLCVLSGCTPRSFAGFYYAGQIISDSITEELRYVTSYEDLVEHQESLEKKFHALVDLLLNAGMFCEAHGWRKNPFCGFWAIELQREIERVAAIEGAYDLLRQIQKEPLIRLSTFEKKQLKSQKN